MTLSERSRSSRSPLILKNVALLAILLLSLAPSGCREEGVREQMAAPSPRQAEDRGEVDLQGGTDGTPSPGEGTSTSVGEGGKLPEGKRDDAVAGVGDSVISGEEFALALSFAGVPAGEEFFVERLGVLEELIEALAAKEAALAAGYAQRPSYRRALVRRRRGYVLPITRKNIRQTVVEPTDEEIDKAVGPLGEIADIVVILAGDRESAERARERILAGEELATVARELSLSPGASLGRFRRTAERGKTLYSPEVEEAIFALETGEVSLPLETEVGYLVVLLEDRRERSREEIDQLRETAAGVLRAQNFQKKVEGIVDERRRSAKIEIRLEDLEGVPLPSRESIPPVIDRALEDLPVAKVNDTVLTLQDLMLGYRNYLLLEHRLPGEYADRLREIIDGQLLYEYGVEKGWDGASEVETALAKYSGILLVSTYADDIALGVVEEKLDAVEAEAYFLERRGIYLAEEKATLAQILVRRREEADEILSRLKAGGDFAAIARERSVDPSAPDGGELGSLWASELVRIFGEEIAEELLLHGRSGREEPLLLRTPEGFHIFLLRRFKASGEGMFEDARERVLPDFLKQSRMKAVEDRFLSDRRKAEVWIDEEKIQAVVPAAVRPHQDILSPHRDGMTVPAGTSPHGK